jgi:hypothetical protein
LVAPLFSIHGLVLTPAAPQLLDCRQDPAPYRRAVNIALLEIIDAACREQARGLASIGLAPSDYVTCLDSVSI